MNSILREAFREGFTNTLCFPNRSKWLQTKVPIWFGSGGILGGKEYHYYLMSQLSFLYNFLFFIYFIIRFRPVEAKNFQTKFKQAEEHAAKLMIPGAHSSGIAEDGENIPEWITIFQHFWEYKKNFPSKTA